MTSAIALADSINVCGDRLFTAEITTARWVWPEYLTHRMMSRNAQSNRAIPVWKTILSVIEDPVIPQFNENKSGMQGGSNLEGTRLTESRDYWNDARLNAVCSAYHLSDRETSDPESKTAWKNIHSYLKSVNKIKEGEGSPILKVHKQYVNRLLEPFSWIKAVISFTEGDNFFALRDHKDALPEIQDLARAIYQAKSKSTPRLLQPGEWHLPLLDLTLDKYKNLPDFEKAKVSGVKCARISYLREHEDRLVSKDLEQYDDFVNKQPAHLSSFEHPACALDTSDRIGNFTGFKQLRKYIAHENITSFIRQ